MCLSKPESALDGRCKKEVKLLFVFSLSFVFVLNSYFLIL
uniref:Uncharacterized protein n=1 Tax=Utricularia reniformis TaxID=192314 RepID=A0A1Y0B2R0_9LAMI|nr:hypothetical protein AEK19_MT1548 [Utricularia reniformis]ART31735.1 hypothetical protein AEK19_MT1548 [Utricularia reniformis]